MGELWGWIMLCFLNKATGVQLWKMLNASNEGCFVPLCNILLLRPIVNYLRQVRRKCKSEERGWNHESLWILSQRNWAWTRLYGHKSLNHNHCHLLLSQAPENVSSDFDSALCWFKIYLEECVEDSKQRQIAGSEPGWHLYQTLTFAWESIFLKTAQLPSLVHMILPVIPFSPAAHAYKQLGSTLNIQQPNNFSYVPRTEIWALGRACLHSVMKHRLLSQCGHLIPCSPAGAMLWMCGLTFCHVVILHLLQIDSGLCCQYVLLKPTRFGGWSDGHEQRGYTFWGHRLFSMHCAGTSRQK